MFVPAAFKKPSRSLAAALAITLAGCGSAFALDAKAFIDNLQDGAQAYGLSLNYQSYAADGDNLTLKNVRLMQKDGQTAAEPPALPIYLGNIVFNSVTAETDGAFAAAAVTAGQDSGQFAAADAVAAGKNKPVRGQIIVSGGKAERIHFTPKGQAYSLARVLPYHNVTVNNVTYQIEGKTTLSLDNIAAHYEKKSGSSFENKLTLAAFTYDPGALPGQDGVEAKKLLTSLGYDKIHGSFSALGLWNPQKGDLDITEYKFTADNMGSISFSGRLGGITQNFADSYQKLALQQAENKALSPQQRQQLNQEALALATRLDFDAFTLTYRDNSLTGRVLDYLSKSSAMARTELVTLIKAAVLQNTQKFQNTAFADRAAGQINAFLDNPKTLQITARPQRPAAFASVLLALGLSPEQLISLLGLDITANK